jgi:hypothetical protein
LDCASLLSLTVYGETLVGSAIGWTGSTFALTIGALG